MPLKWCYIPSVQKCQRSPRKRVFAFLAFEIPTLPTSLLPPSRRFFYCCGEVFRQHAGLISRRLLVQLQSPHPNRESRRDPTKAKNRKQLVRNMPIDLSAGEKTQVTITLRSLAIIVIFSVSAYIWLFTTFATKADASAIATQLGQHIQQTDIYRIDRDIDNTQDKLFDLNERIAAEGETMERRQKRDEYQRRIKKMGSQKTCIQSNQSNCRITN